MPKPTPFAHEDRYRQLAQRQAGIEDKLDLIKDQAPSQVDAGTADGNE